MDMLIIMQGYKNMTDSQFSLKNILTVGHFYHILLNKFESFNIQKQNQLKRRLHFMMVRFGKSIVKLRIPIIIISVLLLIPSFIGMQSTRINYDILSYLPSDIDTMKGQDILLDDFNKGAFAMYVVEGMDEKGASELKSKIQNVDHVSDVLWYDSVADISVPMDILPESFKKIFNSDDATLMAIFFDESTSSDATMNAIEEIRSLSDKQCFLQGMSSVVTDIKNVTNSEMPMYVVIAGLLSMIVIGLFMDSFAIPFIFMMSIGMVILYNMGTNRFMGEISFITKALSAVLQLGVTMDYSIFLYNSYKEQTIRYDGDKKRAMAHAISNTFTSVAGGSTTTIAGFAALCFMTFTLGLDLGIVMAKGVILGVIGVVTILPSFLLVFDKVIEKTRHKELGIGTSKISGFIVRHYKPIIVVFLILLVPAVYGYNNTDVYYDLAGTLPKDLESIQASEKLKENFDMNSTHMVLIDSDLKSKQTQSMLREMNEVDGVKFALGLDSVIGDAIPREMLPESVVSMLKSDKQQLILISSEYKLASDEVNNQCDELASIVRKYDDNGMLIGEAACTKDLIETTDTDFKVVNAISIVAVFLIIAMVFKSISIPIILVSVIEFAIFINMGIPCYTGTVIPFISSVVIGTIQLGATVDYAILMTNRYKKERNLGKDKTTAITIALSASIQSIIISGCCFFAATFGVGIYSKVDMIGSLCNLMARGAVVSMIVVIFVLPAMLMAFDKIIIHSSLGFKNAKIADEKR